MPKVPIQKICRLFGVARSSFYFRSTKTDPMPVQKQVAEVAGRFPNFGVEGLTGQLRFEQIKDAKGKPIGERRVRRSLRALNLLRKPRLRKVATTNSKHDLPRFTNLVKGVAVTHPNQIWVSDITYIRLGSGFVYLAIVMDVFTRSIRGWFLSRSLNSNLTLVALNQGLSIATPEIHHSDQGVQYASHEYISCLESRGVAVSMASVGCPEENGHAERWMRTLKEDHVQMTAYEDMEDARGQIKEFIEEVYQKKRVHSSLGYLPPAFFEAAWEAKSSEEKSKGNLALCSVGEV
jgi:putative transposase